MLWPCGCIGSTVRTEPRLLRFDGIVPLASDSGTALRYPRYPEVGLRVRLKPQDASLRARRDTCQTRLLRSRASQFSRYLLEKTGIPDRDKNARLNPVKLIKYSKFRGFWPHFREENCEALPEKSRLVTHTF